MVAITIPRFQKCKTLPKKATQVVSLIKISNLEFANGIDVWLAAPLWVTQSLTEYSHYLGEAAMIHKLSFTIFIKMPWWNEYHWISFFSRAADWLLPWRYFLLLEIRYRYVYFFSSYCSMMKIISHETLSHLGETGGILIRGKNFQLCVISQGLMYSVGDCRYLNFGKRVGVKCSHHKLVPQTDNYVRQWIC